MGLFAVQNRSRPSVSPYIMYCLQRIDAGVAEWSKLVAFGTGVSQRRFESGRRQTVTVTVCTLWQGSLNLFATSPTMTLVAEIDAKRIIYIH